MLEKLLSVVAAVAVPVFGLALRASPRNRLRQRILDYAELATQVSPHSSEAAEGFKQLVGEASELLLVRENRWLRREFDPAAFAAILFLLAPAVAVFYFAYVWNSGLRVPVLVFAVIWASVWTITGLTQIKRDRDSAREIGDAKAG